MKNMLRNIICLLGAVLLSGLLPAEAQTTGILIRGSVTDKATGEELIGVNVIEYDNDDRILNNVVTDMNGNYAIRITPGSKLAFTYAGYTKQEKENITAAATLNIAMEEQAMQAGDVEVTAARLFSDGMMQIDERDLTTAVASISAEELEDVQAASIDDALQGRLAGVDIVATSGDPGQGMSIRIRGTTSINGDNQPLIVVDGLIFETTIDKDFDFATADENQYGALININPDDIKEITVLKDAASTAVWGPRAENGVLSITTKRGVRGKPYITYSAKVTASNQPDPLPMLNGDQYSTLVMDMLNNTQAGFDSKQYKEFNYDPEDPYNYYNFSQNTEWIDYVTQQAWTLDQNLSLSGGGDKAQYRASVGYMTQDGTTIGTWLGRLTTRLNLDYTVNNKMKFSADFNYTHGDNDRNYTNPRNAAYEKLPNMSVYEWQEAEGTGEWKMSDQYFTPTEISGSVQWSEKQTSGGKFNPAAMAVFGRDNYVSDQAQTTFRLQYQLRPWLRYEGTMSFNVSVGKTKTFLPQEAIGITFANWVNSASDSNSESFGMTTYNRLSGQHNFSRDHQFIFAVQYNTSDSKSKSSALQTTNLATSQLRDAAIPSRVKESSLGGSSSESHSRSTNLAIQAQYNMFDRYNVKLTLTESGSSGNSRALRFKWTPSVSMRWRISGEPLINDLANRLQIDDFSLRASWGIVYSNPSVSQYNNYKTFGYNYLGYTGIYPSNMKYEACDWQATYQTNVGLSLNMLKGRISSSFDYYYKRTDKMLVSADVSSTSGYNSVQINAGKMDNMGWEFSVNGALINRRDLKLRLSANISQTQNIMRYISPYYDTTQGVMSNNGEYRIKIQEDNPLGSFYGYKYQGVYLNDSQLAAHDANGNVIYAPDGLGGWKELGMQFYATDAARGYQFQTGDARYEDINHDGNIDLHDVVYLGDANPKFNGGFGPTLTYKQFSVNLFFNFRYGIDVINQIRMTLEKMCDLTNQTTSVLRRFRYPYSDPSTAPDDLLPRAVWGSSAAYNWLGSDRFVEDGTFLRLKYVTLRYNLPRNFLEKFKLKSGNMSFTMNSIYVWTNYTGQDPEIGYSGTPYQIAKDSARTPRTKDFTFNLSLSF